MSTKSDEIGLNSGSSREGIKGVNGGKVEDSECKSLVENSSYLGQVDGFRVLEESKVFVGEEQSVGVKNEIELGEGRCGMGFKMTDKIDETKNRVVEMMSSDDGWGSWGVMDLVGKVLGGKFCMDDQVDDLKKFGTRTDINSIVADEVENVENFGTKHDNNSVVDWNAWQDVIGEPIFEDGMVVNETIVVKDLDSGKSGAGLSGKEHLVINEQLLDGRLKTKGSNNVNTADVLLQSGCRQEFVTNKEGGYYVSDLVWGKVRSHPWWPGQIFAHSAASDKAMKHFKEDAYLIAYFGDQTFAWNEVSKIKPFQMHFSEMEKQSDAERFCSGVTCALDEVARRVELGLSCQCLHKEVQSKIRYQAIQNAGIKEESSIRDGGDCLSTAESFVPGDFLQVLKSLAEAPVSKTDRLHFGITKAQLLAFNRWKGCYQLSIFEQHNGLLENNAQFSAEEGRNFQYLVNGVLSDPIDAFKVPSKKRKSIAQTAKDASSRKCKQVSNDGRSNIKEKCIPVLTASVNLSLLNDEKLAATSGMKTVSDGKKRGRINSISNAKRQKGMSSPRPSDVCSGRGICSGDVPKVLYNARKSAVQEMIPVEFDPDEILIKLNSAAINPREGHCILSSILGLLLEIRNSTFREKLHLQNRNNHPGKSEGKKSISLENKDLQMEGTKDSYWTDRIIQGYSQEQALFEPKKPIVKDVSGVELETSIARTATLENQNQLDSVILECEAENSSAQINERPGEYFPTALLLNFTNLDSIPSVMNLNEIFRRYGPLDERQTKILSKSKRAKVVFQKRTDAEAAFSSTGKYSIFGPSLLSYRLHYIASKARASSKGKRNTHP